MSEALKCSYHPTTPGSARCTTCARALCPACDHRVRGFPFCQDCIVAGVELLQQQQRFPSASSARRKTSPTIALIMSLIVPGLGAAYNGQTSKALVHFTIFASFFQMMIASNGLPFFVLGAIGALLFATIDAYRTAQLIDAGLAPVTEHDAIARRLYGNPLAWSVLLIVIGTLFMLHTFFNVNLPVREFLPIALIAIGLYMLFDYVQRRREQSQTLPFGYRALSPPPTSVVVTEPLNNVRAGE